MEIETAARKHLLSKNTIKNVVQDRVFKFELPEELEGTGQAAIVVKRSGGWVAPGKNSQEYPMLVIDCFADHSRPQDGEFERLHDREERAMGVYRAVDRILHQVDREQRRWPENDPNGLYVIGCFRGSEPTQPDLLHGVARVRVTYDVQVIH